MFFVLLNIFEIFISYDDEEEEMWLIIKYLDYVSMVAYYFINNDSYKRFRYNLVFIQGVCEIIILAVFFLFDIRSGSYIIMLL